MAVEFHVIQRKVLGDPKGTKKYYASTKDNGETTLENLTEEIEKISAMSGADIRGVLYALVDSIPRHLATGRVVRLGDLGSMRITLRSRGEAQEKDVDTHSIIKSRIFFSPSKKLSDMRKLLSFKKRQQ